MVAVEIEVDRAAVGTMAAVAAVMVAAGHMADRAGASGLAHLWLMEAQRHPKQDAVLFCRLISLSS